MATLVKTKKGHWKAIIRKVGWPASSKTFRTKRDAEDWAHEESSHGPVMKRTL